MSRAELLLWAVVVLAALALAVSIIWACARERARVVPWWWDGLAIGLLLAIAAVAAGVLVEQVRTWP